MDGSMDGHTGRQGMRNRGNAKEARGYARPTMSWFPSSIAPAVGRSVNGPGVLRCDITQWNGNCSSVYLVCIVTLFLVKQYLVPGTWCRYY